MSDQDCDTTMQTNNLDGILDEKVTKVLVVHDNLQL